MGTRTVVCQKWEESERGWGCRPDGYSLHLSEQHRVDYIKSYWDRMPASPPDEYSRPDGTPYLVDIDEETYRQLEEAGGNSRSYNNAYPGSGGTDGWMPAKRNRN